jgi:hypothetical protein
MLLQGVMNVEECGHLQFINSELEDLYTDYMLAGIFSEAYSSDAVCHFSLPVARIVGPGAPYICGGSGGWWGLWGEGEGARNAFFPALISRQRLHRPA